MRALVTGGAGFIGSNLVDALLARGDTVTVVDNLVTGSRANLDGALAAGATLRELDIVDGAALRALFEAEQPELVFHLAAQIDVRRSVADPGFDARVNVEGTVNVLEAARAAGARRVVYSSTGGAIYGEADVVPTPEDALIVEGLNVLQTGRLPRDGKAIPFVSDFFDFSIYLDADEDVLLRWYVDRFLTLRGTAFRDPKSYFHRYSKLSDQEAVQTASAIWTRINLVNLHENIQPTRQRADLILKKGESHLVEEVALRKL